MVTGVRVEADANGTESIVKKAIAHNAIVAEIILLCCIISILFVVFYLFRLRLVSSSNLEIALGGVPARSSPTGFFSPAEDTLKRRVT
jgi:hypothetical protein